MFLGFAGVLTKYGAAIHQFFIPDVRLGASDSAMPHQFPSAPMTTKATNPMKLLLNSILAFLTAVSSGLAAETTGEIGPITTQRVIDSKSQYRFTMQIPIQFHSKE